MALAYRLADAARPIALNYFRTSTPAKAKPGQEFDPVTAADVGVEAALREMLRQARPHDGILGEEGGPVDGTSGRRWVLDPIDGTRAFIAGLPTWTVLIALCDRDEPILSVIDQPFTGERFSGEAGGQTWLERGGETSVLRTRAHITSIHDAIFTTTDPGLFDELEAPILAALAASSKVRRYGLDAYGYAALAMGGVDLVVESGLKPWDVAALIPVIRGAGGEITNWHGGPCHDGGQVVASANRALHEEALQVLRQAAP